MAVTVFNPDAHPETSSVDGMVIRAAGSSLSYTALQAASGTGSSDSGTAANLSLVSSSTSNQYLACRKLVFVFDTSSIPDGDVIDSVTLELYVTSVTSQLDPDIVVVSATTASDTALASSDYQTVTETQYSDTITLTNITTSAFNTWTFNGAGEAAINDTGVTKMGVIFTEPTYISDKSATMGIDTAEATNIPKLTVTHSAATTTSTTTTSSSTSSSTTTTSSSTTQSTSTTQSSSTTQSTSTTISTTTSQSTSSSTSTSSTTTVAFSTRPVMDITRFQ